MEKSGSDYLNTRVLEHIGSSIPKRELVDDKSGKVSSEDVIRIRKDKIIGFFKSNYNWVVYVVLAFITYLAVRIRTRNLGGLRDITTGTWTLGPDLDPFLFLRWAKEIVENGVLFAVDSMRYVPRGFETGRELLLHPYLIAWFHKVAVKFGSESVTHSAVLYPVFMFALTVIAFFFMTRKMFIDSMGIKSANVIALISSFFLSVIPALLPRTIAGIPEKESAAFLFMFLAIYFFLASWKAKSKASRYITAILAGAATAGMAHIWGGYGFVFLAIAPAVLVAFFLEKVDKDNFSTYLLWVVSSLALMSAFSPRYTIRALVTGTFSGLAVLVLFIIVFHYVLFNTNLKRKLSLDKINIPQKIVSSVIAVLILAVLATVVVDIAFVPNQLINVKDTLIKPSTSRLIQTVAENRQPYFTEWSGSFGPSLQLRLFVFFGPVVVNNFPVLFWLFFFGSIYLFYFLVKFLRTRERWISTIAYSYFLIAIIFSRYAGNSKFNGENFISLLFYASGFIVLLGILGYYYFKYHKKGELDEFKKADFSLIVLFTLFFLSVSSARGLVRLIMVLVIPVAIIVSYFAVDNFVRAMKSKEGGMRIFLWVVTTIIILLLAFAGNVYYQQVNSTAGGYVPSVYTQQWQRAMGWVRENVQEDAVFAHWWDYGYWVQSLGERATVLDGGNAQSYWNHLMGRYGLTGSNNRDAIEFMYAHQVTHLLIDSTDIGKYSAFSSIGSDVNYDRASFIPTFSRNNQVIQETKNTTIYFYQGGVGLDGDIIYEEEGNRIFLPAGASGIAGILVERENNGGKMLQPRGIFVYQGREHRLPLRYGYDGEFHDFGSGVEAGFFLFPRIVEGGGGGINIDQDGAMLYLSQRTVKSQLARLYLYKEDNPYFKLVHSEDDFFVAQIKAQNPDFDADIVQFRGIRGPIRIWELDYPEDIELKEEYLSIVYPTELEVGR